MFSLVIVLFFYPFLSQCIHNWAELRVGQAAGGGTEGVVLITGEEYESVKNMCFGDIDRFTDAEHWLLAICEIIASLLLFLFTLWYAMGAGLQRWKEGENSLEKSTRRPKSSQELMKSFREDGTVTAVCSCSCLHVLYLGAAYCGAYFAYEGCKLLERNIWEMVMGETIGALARLSVSSSSLLLLWIWDLLLGVPDLCWVGVIMML